MKSGGEICADKAARRRAIRKHAGAGGKHDLNGIDYLEVDEESQKVLTVYFLGRAPKLTKANVRIDGGRRVRNIHVTGIHVCHPANPRADGCVQITVDRPGDFSTYTLRLVQGDALGRPGREPLAGFDRRYAQLDFSFKAGCATGLDCAPAPCPPPAYEEPAIDYLAKDYASFRQLILDRLSLIMPGWQERHIPDFGITMVELLAYTGDYLSYYQDAVASEAYLDTARQRISVRRHVKLVDYDVHDGCNARAWVTVETDTEGPLGDAYFVSPLSNAWDKAVLEQSDFAGIPAGDYEVFEPVADGTAQTLYPAHNRILFYTWGDRECCLPRGTTTATLTDAWVDSSVQEPPVEPEPKHDHKYGYKEAPPERPPRKRSLHLQPGDLLIFEEVLGPITGQAADADPAHRHVVRLTRVELDVDPLYDQPVVNIEWAAEDALPFPLCLSAIGRAPECLYLPDVCVAHGNVLLVDHGRSVDPETWDVPPVVEENPGCLAEGEPIEAVAPSAPFRPPPLKNAPVTHASPYPLPRVVARRQAQQLSRLMSDVHARVEELWRAALHGHSLTTAEVGELQTIFGAKAVSKSGLGSASDRSALARLLHREARLLAKKARRVRTLAARPAAGYVLPSADQNEIVEMFGETIASRAGIGRALTLGPAGGALIQDPREAAASVRLVEKENEDNRWLPRHDLLDSSGRDRHFVAEIDDEQRARLRFGDGDRGRAPAAGSTLTAWYRVGNGRRGNVGAEAISHIVFHGNVAVGRDLQVRNPLPAQGGSEPESLDEVRLFAPGAFRRRLERAVTSNDYATLAERAVPGRVQRAAAPPLQWTGSWFEAQVAIDPLRSEELDDALGQEIAGYLERYRRIGHDVRVLPARYVPLNVALEVCVLPHYLRAHVERELLDLFSNRELPGGRRGFFHPDNLTFGEGVYLSRIVAAAQAVTGVESVKVTLLQRLFEQPHGELENGVLPLGTLEVARLDNDRAFPEHGTLAIDVGGGR
ncbi:MAG: putative baseplate assembly protein [Acidobacteriota bacterium]